MLQGSALHSCLLKGFASLLKTTRSEIVNMLHINNIGAKEMVKMDFAKKKKKKRFYDATYFFSSFSSHGYNTRACHRAEIALSHYSGELIR